MSNPTTIRQMPDSAKATQSEAEWTEGKVFSYFESEDFKGLAEAINAALADAERRHRMLRLALDEETAALAAKDEQHATATKQAAEALAENHRQQLAAEREKTKQAHDAFTARDAFAKRVERTNQQLREQLAAAVAALKTIRSWTKTGGAVVSDDLNTVIDAALARIGATK